MEIIALVIYGIYSGRLIINILFPELINESSIDFKYIFYQTLISTLVILITAEFLPKVFFQIYANRLFKLFSFPAFIFYYLFSDYILIKFFKTKGDQIQLTFSKSELGNYIEEQLESTKDIENVDSEIQIFQNALDFSDLRSRETMVPRTEIIAVDISTKSNELKEIFIKTGYSKILVYKTSLDDIIGHVNAFELFKKPKTIKSILLPVEIVPESMMINDVLNSLMKKRKSIAIVVDEYGGTSGLIS